MYDKRQEVFFVSVSKSESLKYGGTYSVGRREICKDRFDRAFCVYINPRLYICFGRRFNI